MDKIVTTLDAFKKSFKDLLPDKDGRSSINPLEFISALIFSLHKDTLLHGLEGIRRSLIAITGKSISRSAFNERLGSRRTLNLLTEVANQLGAVLF